MAQTSVLHVDEEQAVTGEGFTDSSEYTCTTPQGTSTIPETTLQYAVTGTKDEGRSTSSSRTA